MFIFLFIISAIIAFVAYKDQRNPFFWFLYSTLFTPVIALGIFFILKNVKDNEKEKNIFLIGACISVIIQISLILG